MKRTDSPQQLGNQLCLKISIPQVSKHTSRIFRGDQTIAEVLKYLYEALPSGIRLDRCRLYYNGLRLLDETRNLTSYGVQNNAVLEFKRGEEYEFYVMNNKSKGSIIIDSDTPISSSVLKMIQWSSPENEKISELSDDVEVLRRDEKTTTPKSIPFDPKAQLISYHLRENDILVVKFKGKSTEFGIEYSPIDFLETYKNTFKKSGYLTKQGGGEGGRKNWKKRWFVLSEDRLEYFKSESELDRPLGVIMLSDYIALHDDEESKKPYCFLLETIPRIYRISANTKKDMDAWMNSLRKLGEIARSDSKNNLRASMIEQKIKMRTKKQDIKVSDITKPYNVVHLSHVNFDLTWSSESPSSIFDFKETIGKGAFGSVVRAIHKESGFPIAVKQMNIAQKKILESMEKEIKFLKKCKNANIVSYYGTIIRDEQIWILMDYCGVGSVSDLIKSQFEPLEEAEITYIVTETLKGLAYLHALHILHLDVKPANILLTQDGLVKLADFGVSKQLAPTNHQALTINPKLSRAGLKPAPPPPSDAKPDSPSASSPEPPRPQVEWVGSPLFMAPEVIKRESCGPKSDVWSLGISVYEMAEAQPPNTDIMSMKDIVKLLDRPPPTFQNPKLWSKLLNDFLAKTLTVDLNERPSAFDLLQHPLVATSKGPDAVKSCIARCMRIRSNS